MFPSSRQTKDPLTSANIWLFTSLGNGTISLHSKVRWLLLCSFTFSGVTLWHILNSRILMCSFPFSLFSLKARLRKKIFIKSPLSRPPCCFSTAPCVHSWGWTHKKQTKQRLLQLEHSQCPYLQVYTQRKCSQTHWFWCKNSFLVVFAAT